MSQQNRAARPDVTLGSRWELTRRSIGGGTDYIGVVREIDWSDNTAHVFDEAEQLRDQWVALGILTIPATQPPPPAKPTYEELETLCRELLKNAAGSLGFFEYQRQQGSDVAPDEQWLKPLREVVATGRELFPQG